MKCPVCKGSDYREVDLRTAEFAEDLFECRVCASIWAVNHGRIEVVKDTQNHSFLEAISERVEGDDYNYVS